MATRHQQFHLDAMKLDNLERDDGPEKTRISDEITAAELVWPDARLTPSRIHDWIELPDERLDLGGC